MSKEVRTEGNRLQRAARSLGRARPGRESSLRRMRQDTAVDAGAPGPRAALRRSDVGLDGTASGTPPEPEKAVTAASPIVPADGTADQPQARGDGAPEVAPAAARRDGSVARDGSPDDEGKIEREEAGDPAFPAQEAAEVTTQAAADSGDGSGGEDSGLAEMGGEFRPRDWQDATSFMRVHDGDQTDIPPDEQAEVAEDLVDYVERKITAIRRDHPEALDEGDEKIFARTHLRVGLQDGSIINIRIVRNRGSDANIRVTHVVDGVEREDPLYMWNKGRDAVTRMDYYRVYPEDFPTTKEADLSPEGLREMEAESQAAHKVERDRIDEDTKNRKNRQPIGREEAKGLKRLIDMADSRSIEEVTFETQGIPDTDHLEVTLSPDGSVLMDVVEGGEAADHFEAEDNDLEAQQQLLDALHFEQIDTFQRTGLLDKARLILGATDDQLIGQPMAAVIRNTEGSEEVIHYVIAFVQTETGQYVEHRSITYVSVAQEREGSVEPARAFDTVDAQVVLQMIQKLRQLREEGILPNLEANCMELFDPRERNGIMEAPPPKDENPDQPPDAAGESPAEPADAAEANPPDKPPGDIPPAKEPADDDGSEDGRADDGPLRRENIEGPDEPEFDKASEAAELTLGIERLGLDWDTFMASVPESYTDTQIASAMKKAINNAPEVEESYTGATSSEIEFVSDLEPTNTNLFGRFSISTMPNHVYFRTVGELERALQFWFEMWEIPIDREYITDQTVHEPQHLEGEEDYIYGVTFFKTKDGTMMFPFNRIGRKLTKLEEAALTARPQHPSDGDKENLQRMGFKDVAEVADKVRIYNRTHRKQILLPRSVEDTSEQDGEALEQFLTQLAQHPIEQVMQSKNSEMAETIAQLGERSAERMERVEALRQERERLLGDIAYMEETRPEAKGFLLGVNRFSLRDQLWKTEARLVREIAAGVGEKNPRGKLWEQVVVALSESVEASLRREIFAAVSEELNIFNKRRIDRVLRKLDEINATRSASEAAPVEATLFSEDAQSDKREYTEGDTDQDDVW